MVDLLNDSSFRNLAGTVYISYDNCCHGNSTDAKFLANGKSSDNYLENSRSYWSIYHRHYKTMLYYMYMFMVQQVTGGLHIYICHFQNEKQSGVSRILQLLVGLLLGAKLRPAWRCIPSNGSTSNCEMRLAPSGEWISANENPFWVGKTLLLLFN